MASTPTRSPADGNRHKLRRAQVEGATSDAAATLEVEGLTKRYGSVVALDDVSFRVTGPGLIGILGPNGAGKTTLLDILQGLSRASAGSYRLFGATPEPYPRRRVGVVMQREPRLERVTVSEYADLFAAIYGVSDGRARILERAQLGDRASIPMKRLSGGEGARLAIACALIGEPELLFLDEPTAPLDPAAKRAIGEVLRELGRERTVILTTHDLREADALCEELLFLVGGKLRASGRRSELIAAVPPEARSDVGAASLEDAFFHFCALRLEDGEARA